MTGGCALLYKYLKNWPLGCFETFMLIGSTGDARLEFLRDQKCVKARVMAATLGYKPTMIGYSLSHVVTRPRALSR